MKNIGKFGILFVFLFGFSWSLPIYTTVNGASDGLIFFYQSKDVRIISAWVVSDINGDGWREICFSFPAILVCLDVNPANGGPKELWRSHAFHHELYGIDSGIDLDGDNITEQLVFEMTDYYHYLVNGSTGETIAISGTDGRRSQLYWPYTSYGRPKCGVGLGANVNGQGSNDYVIIGMKLVGEPMAVLQCIEGLNGSLIWERELAATPYGVELIQINFTTCILAYTSENISAYSVDGTSLWNRSAPNSIIAVIPNGSGPGIDAVAVSGNGFRYINASDSSDIWTNSTNIGAVFYVGDVDGNGIGDFGALLDITAQDAVIFNGTNGDLIRHHPLQDPDDNDRMHGVTYCGDIDGDGCDDYGYHGHYFPHNIYSGKTGDLLLSIYGEGFSTEYMLIESDINGNGYADILFGNWPYIGAVDGSSTGSVQIKYGNDIPGFPLIIVLFSLIALLSLAYHKNFKFFSQPFLRK